MIEPWLTGYRNYLSWCQNMFAVCNTWPEIFDAWVKVCTAFAQVQSFSFTPLRPRPERRDITRLSYGV